MRTVRHPLSGLCGFYVIASLAACGGDKVSTTSQSPPPASAAIFTPVARMPQPLLPLTNDKRNWPTRLTKKSDAVQGS
jgi:hypothetical protein